MSQVPHELAETFPGRAGEIRDLRKSSLRFRMVMNDYHQVNRAIHRAETEAGRLDEFTEARLRRERRRLVAEIAGMLA